MQLAKSQICVNKIWIILNLVFLHTIVGIIICVDCKDHHEHLKSHVLLSHLGLQSICSVIGCSSVMIISKELKSVAIRAAVQKWEGQKQSVKLLKFYRATKNLQVRFYANHGCMIPSLFVFSSIDTYPGHFHLMSVVYQLSLSICLPKSPFTKFNFLPFFSLFLCDWTPPSLLFSVYWNLTQG